MLFLDPLLSALRVSGETVDIVNALPVLTFEETMEDISLNDRIFKIPTI